MSNSIVIIWVSLNFTIIIASIITMWRNEKVSRFRRKLLEDVSNSIKRDGYPEDWRKRFDAMEEVSYPKMVTEFWRPLTMEEWFDEQFIKAVRGGDTNGS